METRSQKLFKDQKMTLDFETLIKKKMPLPEVFKRAHAYELFSLDPDTYTHQACKVLAENKDIMMLHVHWDFKEIFPLLQKPTELHDLYEIMECGFYMKGMRFVLEFLHITLAEAMEEGKFIYVVLSIENYELDEFEEGNKYGHHCTALMFYPKSHNEYDCFYINSHGERMMGTKDFDDRYTRRRYTRHSFEEPIDVVCIKSYLNFLRKTFVELENRVQIAYDGSKYHNYYGPNLQGGDDHGVCFAFPLIIWYYISNFYNKERMRVDTEGKKHTIRPMKEYLEGRDLIALANACFLVFHKKYEEAIWNEEKVGRNKEIYLMSEKENTYKAVHKYTKLSYEEIMFNRRVDAIIEKSCVTFVKRIALGIVMMLTHPTVKNIIYS